MTAPAAAPPVLSPVDSAAVGSEPAEPCTGGAAGAASFPLPSAAVAAVDAGRPVYFRHARTGKVYRLITESTDAKGDAAALSPENVAADGGERLTELEALRRAVTEADAELAAGLEPLTLESFWAGVEADFPELRRQAE